MRILVCIKQVPATTKVDIDPTTGVIKRDGASAKMNPYDLFALESALKIKEMTGDDTRITVLTMGPMQAKKIIYEAYSMGADDGYIISDRKFAGADVLATSYTIASGVRRAEADGGKFDLIICGKQTTDGDTAQVGPEMSEYLNLPCLANVSAIDKIDEENGELFVSSDISHIIMKVKIKMPCLLCVEKDIYMPRLPSYKKKLATAGREINVITFADLDDKDESHYGLSGSPTQVKRIFPPAVNDERELWQGSGKELAVKIADKLRAKKLV